MMTSTTHAVPVASFLRRIVPWAVLVVTFLAAGSEASARKRTVWVKKGTMVVALRDAAVRTRPDAEAPELYTAVEGERLRVTGAAGRGAWIRVQDAEGTPGWLRTRHIAVARGQGRLVFADDDGADYGDAPGRAREAGDVSFQRARAPRTNMGVRAGFGVLVHRQAFKSAGSSTFSEYRMSQTSPTLGAQAGGTWRFGRLVVGADGRVLTTMGGSGVTVQSEMGTDSLAWRRLEYGADLIVGTPISKDMTLHGRVGYHTASTRVEASSMAKLPSESLSGVRFGAELDMPHVGGSEHWGMVLGAHGYLAPKFEQTVGMREGTESRSTSFGGHATVSRRMTDKATVVASYALDSQQMTFGGENERDANAAGGSRKDFNHSVSVSMAFGF